MDARISSGLDRLNAAIDPLNSIEKLSLLTKKDNLTWYPGKASVQTEGEFLDNVELLHSIEDVGFRVTLGGGNVVFIRAVVL